jgi:hypothetical protein
MIILVTSLPISHFSLLESKLISQISFFWCIYSGVSARGDNLWPVTFQVTYVQSFEIIQQFIAPERTLL